MTARASGRCGACRKRRETFAAAGFEHVQVHTVPGDVMNNYYICHKIA